MSKSIYVNRSSSRGSSGGGGLRRALAVVLIIVLLALALVLFYVRRQDREADTVIERFEEALDAREYNEILDIHRQAQERSLSRRQSEKNRALYAEAVIEIEQVLIARFDEIGDSLLASQQPSLSDDDIAYLSGLSEFSSSKLSELIDSIAMEVLSGGLTRQHASAILSELSDTNLLTDEIDRMNEELPELVEASEGYQAAMALYDNNSYIASALSLSDTLGSGVVTQGSLAAQLLSSELVRVRQTMRPILISEIEDLMARGRYISAERQMEELLRFFPDDQEIISLYEEIRQNVPTDLVQYSGNLEHITLRPLIVNTAVGLGDSSVAQTADSTMLTAYEFRRILEALHLDNYVLVDLETVLNDQGTVEPIYLPSGKKPLFLTLEGFNYYPARRLSGNVQNLLLNDSGRVVGQYLDENGQTQVARESEAIGIVEAFIEQHPDFSFDGARGTITLTGNMGVFGYVYTEEQLMMRNQQAAAFGLASESFTVEQMLEQKNEAVAVIDALKATGWVFGSQTYSGSEVPAMTEEQLIQDTERWMENVGELTGPVSVLAYPNGAILTGDDSRKLYLQEQGFRYFLGIGPNPYAVSDSHYLYMDRLYLGGYSLRNNLPGRLFDVAEVYDPARRIPLTGG